MARNQLWPQEMIWVRDKYPKLEEGVVSNSDELAVV